MKKLFTTALVFCSVCAFAQQSRLSALDTYLTTSSPEFKYSPYAKMQSTEYRLMGLREQDYDGAEYIDFDSANFVYDEGYGMPGLDLLSPKYTDCFIVQYDGFIWIPYANLHNTFDGDHVRQNMVISFWDGATFIADQRYTFTYDDDGNVTEQLIEYFIGGVYENIQRNIYTYTLDGKLDYYTIQNWDGVSDWDDYGRYVYTYDGEGRTSIMLYQLYIGGVWEDEGRSVYLYNAEDKVTSDTYQLADGVGGFEDYSRTIFEYDGSNFLTVSTLQYFELGVWDNYSKTESENNAEGLPDISYTSYWDGTVWEPSLKVNNTYEEYDFTSVQDNELSDAIILYPNPADEQIKLQFPVAGDYDITIIDMNGHLISSEQVINTDNHIINLEPLNLPQGIYHVKMKSGEHGALKSFEKF